MVVLKIFRKTGIICMCSPEEQQEMACNMKKLEVGFKLMSSKEIEQKFCGLNSCGMTGIFDEEAGILKATDCLWALKVLPNYISLSY